MGGRESIQVEFRMETREDRGTARRINAGDGCDETRFYRTAGIWDSMMNHHDKCIETST